MAQTPLQVTAFIPLGVSSMQSADRKAIGFSQAATTHSDSAPCLDADEYPAFEPSECAVRPISSFEALPTDVKKSIAKQILTPWITLADTYDSLVALAHTSPHWYAHALHVAIRFANGIGEVKPLPPGVPGLAYIPEAPRWASSTTAMPGVGRLVMLDNVADPPTLFLILVTQPAAEIVDITQSFPGLDEDFRSRDVITSYLRVAPAAMLGHLRLIDSSSIQLARIPAPNLSSLRIDVYSNVRVWTTILAHFPVTLCTLMVSAVPRNDVIELARAMGKLNQLRSFTIGFVHEPVCKWSKLVAAIPWTVRSVDWKISDNDVQIAPMQPPVLLPSLTTLDLLVEPKSRYPFKLLASIVAPSLARVSISLLFRSWLTEADMADLAQLLSGYPLLRELHVSGAGAMDELMPRLNSREQASGMAITSALLKSIPTVLTTLFLRLPPSTMEGPGRPLLITRALVVPPQVEYLTLFPMASEDDAIDIAQRIPSTVRSLTLGCHVSTRVVQALAESPRPHLTRLALHGLCQACDQVMLAALDQILTPAVKDLSLSAGVQNVALDACKLSSVLCHHNLKLKSLMVCGFVVEKDGMAALIEALPADLLCELDLKCDGVSADEVAELVLQRTDWRQLQMPDDNDLGDVMFDRLTKRGILSSDLRLF
ncbi:hypothetical protein AMAG_19410 [Allomyces macrogynus ATCC 38327]|uniref:Uncharacterized protein n=1 Tax=Allomyces macrogynus (strain ATCC 38327) TaxID=578462 RepID=A0A0L0SR50_ALLM3|nr:hypothetical protein AMAG_19410 [Allomyces macrogynus ATCC 38327]|eukprot:KNE64998.1 hypothetical protein AMAG_19410 [Allomyces macrogynus ATCC 38327]